MTVNDIIDVDTADIMRMTKKELQQALKDVNRATSRRTRELRKARKTRQSPAYRGFQDSGGTTINTSDQQTINQMRKEFFRGQQFLKSKTSTITGTNRYIHKMQRITGQTAIEKNKNFWDIYSKFRQVYPALFTHEGSKKVERVIKRTMGKGGGLEDVMNEAEKIYKKTYKDADNVDWGKTEDDTNDVDTYEGYF